uniref:hypothetical protein n=1 Tax=Nostoc sp. CCY 9925 TaxID=3103865 RepID=UPI0039C68720
DERVSEVDERVSEVDERVFEVDERVSEVDERVSEVDERVSEGLPTNKLSNLVGWTSCPPFLMGQYSLVSAKNLKLRRLG